MITLETKGYCQNCPEFKPVTEEVSAENFYGEYRVDRYVVCKHHYRCENIADFIYEEIQKAAEDKALKDNALTKAQAEDCRRAAESFQHIR